MGSALKIMAPTLPLAFAVAFAAAGCGTTSILTNEKNATIYVNGQEMGKGNTKVRRRGGPGAVSVTVKAEDGRQATKLTRREFSGLGWAYPSQIQVSLPPPPEKSGWGKGEDPWSKAPEGFRSQETEERTTSSEWGAPDEAEPKKPKKGKKPRQPKTKQDQPESSSGDSVWEQPPPTPQK